MAEADRAGQGSSDFRAFLRDLPDEIALARERGLPVELVVDTPLPAHAQRLMDTLGVPVEVREVTVISAQQAVATRLCADPNCKLDAEARSHFCREHTERAQAANGNRSWSRKAKTREEIIDALQRYARDHGRPPSQDDLKKVGGYVSAGAATRAFGTWAAALEAAGLPPPTGIRRDVWTRERAIEKLQEVVAGLGHVPSSEEIAGLGLPGSGAFNRLFGSWGGYVEAAGYERPTNKRTRTRARSTSRSAPQKQPDAPPEPLAEPDAPPPDPHAKSMPPPPEQPAAEPDHAPLLHAGSMFGASLIARLLRLHASTLRDHASRYSADRERFRDAAASLSAIADFLDEAA